MKKMMMMAMMFVASATAFAGDSDALKAVMKSKNYAEAAQLLKQNIDQMANAAEKAKAYNYLVDLSMKKINKETGTIMENQVGRQMGRAESEIVPYDTLGLVDAICDALNDAVECNKYDQQPDAKGKIKPKFAEKNAQRIWPVRIHLVNTGQEEANKGHKDKALKYWGAFADSGVNPLFDAQNHEPEKEYFGQLAFFAGRYAYDQGDMGRDPVERERTADLRIDNLVDVVEDELGFFRLVRAVFGVGGVPVDVETGGRFNRIAQPNLGLDALHAEARLGGGKRVAVKSRRAGLRNGRFFCIGRTEHGRHRRDAVRRKPNVLRSVGRIANDRRARHGKRVARRRRTPRHADHQHPRQYY